MTRREPASCSRYESATLIAWLAPIAEKARRLPVSSTVSTLIAWLAFVTKQARRLIGQCRTGNANSHGGTENQRRDNLTSHDFIPFPNGLPALQELPA